MKERKIEPCCPDHSMVYRAKHNGKIVCVAYKCNWEEPAYPLARRKDEIPDLNHLKREFR
jgi:hypothetical protein